MYYWDEEVPFNQAVYLRLNGLREFTVEGRPIYAQTREDAEFIIAILGLNYDEYKKAVDAYKKKHPTRTFGPKEIPTRHKLQLWVEAMNEVCPC